MAIILFLGQNVKAYNEKGSKLIKEIINSGSILCEQCLQPMKYHSRYTRGIKETEQKIAIVMVWCESCKKWHALLPDFLLPYKHYSGNEIESVFIDSTSMPVNQIETEASESTVKRWICQIGERVQRTMGILKNLFGRLGKAINEAAIIPGSAYNELEQILEMAPSAIKSSGNKLGLANIWLGTNTIRTYI